MLHALLHGRRSHLWSCGWLGQGCSYDFKLGLLIHEHMIMCSVVHSVCACRYKTTTYVGILQDPFKQLDERVQFLHIRQYKTVLSAARAGMHTDSLTHGGNACFRIQYSQDQEQRSLKWESKEFGVGSFRLPVSML